MRIPKPESSIFRAAALAMFLAASLAAPAAAFGFSSLPHEH